MGLLKFESCKDLQVHFLYVVKWYGNIVKNKIMQNTINPSAAVNFIV